jgi:hypothetical protein
VQKGIQWGTSFQITTPDAADIGQVVLSRLPSPQHITDSDARTLRLSFTKQGATLTATAPPNGIAAPPGYYYLFILNGRGVPSVARIVHVGSTTDLASTTPIYTSGDVNNPPPPSGGSATEPEDSSYQNNPPPLPMGVGAVGMIARGAGVPARRRRREDDAA